MKLIFALVIALLLPVAAQAADPAAPATEAARSWLGLIDAGSYDRSWTQASALFRQRVSQDQWGGMVKSVRESLGAVVSREPAGAQLATTLPGAPDGKYAVVKFTTKFAKKASATETVTMMMDGGTWKAAGYFIQ